MNKVYIIARSSLLNEVNGITVRSIRHSYDGASTLTFTRDIEFDTEPVFQLDDEVMCMVNGVTLFSGWLIDISPELNTNEQRTYSCADSRFKLSKITFVKNDSARVTYNSVGDLLIQTELQYILSDWNSYSEIFETGGESAYDLIFKVGKTYGEIMVDVLQTPGLIPSSVISSINTASILRMNIEAPEMSFTAMSVEEILRMIIDKAGKFGYYITPAKQLIVYELDSLIQKNVYAGQIGQTVEAHSEYDVWQANLNFSIVDTRTKCTIEGRRKWIETKMILEPFWDYSLEQYWGFVTGWTDSTVTIMNTYISGWAFPPNIDYAGLNYVFRRYKYDLNTKIAKLIDPPIIGHYPISTGTTVHNNYTGAELSYNPIPLDGQVYTDVGVIKLTNPAFARADSVYNTIGLFVSYASGKTLYDPIPVYLQAIIEGNPFKVTVGEGESELYIIDESFIYEEHLARYNAATLLWEPAGIAHDDSAKMTDLATQMLSIVNDSQTSGNIKLDSIKTDWDMGKSVNIRNLSAGLWSNLNAVVFAVEWNLTNEESTTLTISTKQYIGGAPSYEELKRRIMISQKIKDMEAKISALKNTGSGSSNIASNPGSAYSNDVQASGDGLDFTSIRKDIQAAMDASYFTIQKHDHTSDSQGGPAFADKGGYLL